MNEREWRGCCRSPITALHEGGCPRAWDLSDMPLCEHPDGRYVRSDDEEQMVWATLVTVAGCVFVALIVLVTLAAVLA